MLILTLKYDCTFRSLRSVSLSGPYPYDSRSLFPGLIHLPGVRSSHMQRFIPKICHFHLASPGRLWLCNCSVVEGDYEALAIAKCSSTSLCRSFLEACADWHEKLMYVDWRHGICGADWHFDKHDFAVCRLTRWHTLICNVPIDTSLNVDMQCADWHFELWDKQGVDWHFDMHWYARCRMALGICRFAQLVQEYLVWSIDWI